MARPSTGNGLTLSELQRIMDSRKGEISKLYRKRTTLEKDLTAIDRQIAKLEGSGGGGRRGAIGSGTRAQNDKSLVETLLEVMQGGKGPMGVKDIVEAVEKAGYRSSSANFRGLVNQTLIKENKRFESTGRGVYGLKGAAKKA